MNNLWIIDACTPVAFRGNPAAVYLLGEFPDDKRLQLLAARANLSDTAFVVKTAPLEFSLRWFTPTTEIRLCGHATLAAAHVLTQVGQAKIGDTITFHTLSGQLTAKIKKNGIQLDFPTLAGAPVKPDPMLLAGLGVPIIACEKNRDDLLVEVADFETLLSIKPIIKKLSKLHTRGVIVTTAKDVPENFDFASRFFAPSLGIEEDPVTGSAHTFLAPYWAKKLGKTKFSALQASRACGILEVELAGDRTLITGECATTLKGTINLSTQKNKNKEIFA
jgi:PhzF family phenazine biosynthesis protein